MITIVCWKWKKHDGFAHDYTSEHVNILQRMVERHYPHPHRFVCITDDPTGVECETYPLWGDLGLSRNACGAHLPSCYRRLYLFSKALSRELAGDGRIVSLDLDCVITGDLSPLWNRDDAFVGWRQQRIDGQPCYNGSMWMFKAGHHFDLWEKFRPDETPIMTRNEGYYGSDQAWISYYFKGRASGGWDATDGVHSYPRGVRNHGLPSKARIVMFNGKRKPWEHDKHLSVDGWIKEHYR